MTNIGMELPEPEGPDKHDGPRITDKQLKSGTALGLAVIVAWFVMTKTTWLLAFGSDGTKASLSQVRGICDSGLGQFARLFSHQASTACQNVDLYMTLANIGAVVAGLIAAGCFVLLIVRHQNHQPMTGDAPAS